MKTYKEIPINFYEIQDYFVTEKQDIINHFITGEKYFFYDTCSLITHSDTLNRNYIINFLKNKHATIILTRTVLMELSSSEDNKIHTVQLNYLKELHDSNIKIILLDEEFILHCLNAVININNENANKLLGFAINEISKFKGTIYEIKKLIQENHLKKLIGKNPGHKELYSDFFTFARSMKESKDNLGEELMFICFIILTKIPIGKCIFFSNDLNSRTNIISLNDYIYKHHDKKEPYQLTTATLLYKMYIENILTDRTKMIDILNSSTEGNIKVYYTGESDIKLQFDSFSKEDLVDRIMIDSYFKIIY
ncbi:MAG: transposase [Anaeromicrobium sp.]|jgi:hypothetical protein|uniref:transposase n=1 Tax=Anaeromicrobium sp. TaxID=1929132 RepID=UPI0025F289D2|nr:transposase [Anaeromicrobium sp.]MCT4595457.1 transposase [Anaeromicrobium sp.]